jgi:hypothetical protein
MKQYDAKKISYQFTNLDYAKQFFPKVIYETDETGEKYVLNSHWQIFYLGENELFAVDYTYYDHSIGYVTDDDIFQGDFGQCIEFIKKEMGL